MYLGQIRKDRVVTAAIFEGGVIHAIPSHTFLDLIRRSEAEGIPLPELAGMLAMRGQEKAAPIVPIHAPEIWACGCTYQVSAEFRDTELGTREGMYAYVCGAERPEIFFKGTARVSVGTDQTIGIRSDSRFTAPEPELAVVLGSGGQVLGYTLANDVSAWDIERENALYLPQSKVYNCCCALGPWFVTPDSLPNPYALEMTCTIRRGDSTTFSGSVSTSRLSRKIETLIDYLRRSNHVPAGTVVLTGTGIIVPEEAALAAGDSVEIFIPEIGTLRNRAVAV